MARMIPAIISDDRPQSEREIFRRFRDETPAAWTVFYSVQWTRIQNNGQAPEEGEADFVVFDPQRGFLTLEVKGGGILFENGQWSSTDRDGTCHPLTSPVSQAKHAAHELSAYLNAQSWFTKHDYRPNFGFGVVFPDIEAPARGFGLSLPRDLVVDRMDCMHFEAAIRRLFDKQVNQHRTPQGYERAFRQALFPRIDTRICLRQWLADERRKLDSFTDEQMGVLNHLEHYNRLAIEGTAGSGKTLLALEKARRLAAKGQKILLLCFNLPLAKHLKSLSDGFEVEAFHELAQQLIQQAGMPYEVPQGYKEKNHFYEEQLPYHLMSALSALPDRRWDALIVDEGQDFRENWWPVIGDLLADPEKGTWIVFHDPSQNIYEGSIPKMLNAMPYPLRYNCRNTGNIATYLSELLETRVETYPGTPEGLDVERIHCSSRDGVVQACEKILEELVGKGQLPCEEVVFLSTRNRNKSALAKAGKVGRWSLAPLGQELGKNQIRFDSLFKFKGLEADAVVLVDVKEGERTSNGTHLYVGASRARQVLRVVEMSEVKS